MWISIVSIEDFNSHPLPLTSKLMKFQQSNRMVMWLHQENNKNIIIIIISINNLFGNEHFNHCRNTSIQYHKTKKCLARYPISQVRRPIGKTHCFGAVLHKVLPLTALLDTNVSKIFFFYPIFPITDIAMYRLNQSRGQIIWNA